MAEKPEIVDVPPPALPAWDKGEWMKDRDVFVQETVDQNGEKKRRLFVPEAAKRRWNVKNPNKFTPEVALEIIANLMAGATKGDAAEAAGVSMRAFSNWLNWAEEEERSTEELRAFAFWCNRGRALCRLEALRKIAKASSDDWKAAAFILERTSTEYRQHTGVVHENPDGTPCAPPPVQIQFVDGPGDNPQATIVSTEPPSDSKP